MSIALALLARLWPYILCAALALGAYIYAQKACWNDACHSQRARADQLEVANKAAHERSDALAILWANQLGKADEAMRKALAAQRETFTALGKQASALNPLPTLVLGAPTVVLLDRISAAANLPADSAAPAVDNAGPETISEAHLTEQWNAAADAYASVNTQRLACINRYNSLRSTQ